MDTVKMKELGIPGMEVRSLSSGRELYSPLPLGLAKAMAPHSSTLAWRIPWTKEPGKLQSMGSHRVRHD